MSSKADIVATSVLPVDKMTDYKGLIQDQNRPPTAGELLKSYAQSCGYVALRGLPDETQSALKDYLNGQEDEEDEGEEDEEGSKTATATGESNLKARLDVQKLLTHIYDEPLELAPFQAAIRLHFKEEVEEQENNEEAPEFGGDGEFQEAESEQNPGRQPSIGLSLSYDENKAKDSGKSAFLSEFARRQEISGQGHPIYLNMRAGTFTAANFAKELKSQLNPFLAAAAEYAKTIPTVDNVAASADAALPTLIIDEAHRLLEWSLAPEEQQHLRTLMAYFIMVTKERQEANVILCTSEDFFRFWLHLHVGPERYQPRMVGDLTEEQAREFFLMALLDGWVADGYKFPEDLWKEIFSFVGGRTLLLSRLALNLSSYLEDESLLLKAWVSQCKILVDATRQQVEMGFGPMDFQGNLDSDRPCWNVEDYEAVLRELTQAEGGVVSVQYLTGYKIISKAALHSLVQHNFLHYRSFLCPWADDLAWNVLNVQRNRFSRAGGNVTIPFTPLKGGFQ
ncbi:hypothetical protein SELMODRAFT_430843 [Selaginella moellendorffii]|uniref:Uncharacterized protein n=1 Tax=Selaginella moellendorffii TaxID=88036 RepID=D8TAP7_SELML|nr:hypothetical protein SELMODRAFT_430843 [Selaginella moellendorffii]